MANFSGYGSTMTVADAGTGGAAGAATAVPGLISIEIPGVEMDLTESSALSDTVRQYATTIKAGGKAHFVQNFAHAEYARELANTGISLACVVTLPDTHTIAWTMIFTKSQPEQIDDKTIHLKTEGQVTSVITYT